MSTKVLHKRSSIPNNPPSPGAVQPGELVLNTADGKVFLKKDDGTIVDTSQQIFQRDTSFIAEDNGTTSGTIRAYVHGDQKILIDAGGTTFTGPITVDNAETITLKDQDGSNYIAISAPDNVDNSYFIKLPPNLPVDPSILSIDGEGNASWSKTDSFGGNRVYASGSIGDDNNDGINAPVRTIKRACQIAASLGQVPKVDPGTDYYNAKRLLEDNRAFIQEEAIGFIKWNYVSFNTIYDETKCRRDVGIILNAVMDDIVFDTNYRTLTAGFSYLRSYTSKITSTQKERTISALNHARDLAKAVAGIDSTTVTAIDNKFGIITDIINNETTAGAPALSFDYTGISSGVANAALLLQANRTFLVDNLVGWIDAQISGNIAPFYTGYTYAKSLCERDFGYVIDALTYDLLYGGNRASEQGGLAYYQGAVSIIQGQEAQSAAGYGYLKSIIDEVVQNISVAPTYTSTSQVSGTSGSSGAASTLQGLLDIIVDIVQDGSTTTPIVNPTYANGVNYTIGGPDRASVLASETTIKDQTIAWINSNYLQTYDEDKCRRDTGYMIDAVSYDLALGTNYNSVTAGLAYQRVNTFNVRTKELIQTIGAIGYAKTESAASLVSDAGAVASSNAAFDEILDILENNTPNALSFPTPGTLPYTKSVEAKAQLIQNRNFLKAEVTAYINSNFVGYLYTDVIQYRCERDLNYILTAASYDLALGTNYNAVTAGLAYQRANSAYVLSDQKIVTVQGIVKAQELAYAELAGSATAQTRSDAAFNEVIDILSNGVGSADALTFPTPTGANQDVVDAKDQLQANKAFIKAEVTAWIAEQVAGGSGIWNSFTYNATKCARDVGYIVDALSYDILYGGNSATINNAKAYYIGAANSQLGIGEGPATVSAFAHLQSVVSSVVQGITVTPSTGNGETQSFASGNATTTEATILTNLIQIIKNAVTIGSISQLPATVYPDLTWVASGIKTARNNLVTHIGTIVSNVSSFITTAFNNFSYDAAKCSRDVGYIVDALCYDVLYGGDSATITNARAYYVGATSQLGAGEGTVTTLAYNYLKTLVDNVVQGNAIPAPYQTVVPQVTSGTAATATEGTVLKNLIQIINDVINAGNTNSLPAPTYPSLTWVTSSVLTARSQLIADKPTIINGTIDFISTTYTGFTYNEAVCKRDAGLIVDAVIYDIILGGNRRSVEAGQSYYEAGNSSAAIVVADQLTETIKTVEYIRDLSLAIIQDQDLGYTYQNLKTQVKYPTLPGTAAVTDVTNRFNTIISILSGNPAPTIVEPNFDVIPVTIQVSAGDFYIDNPIIIPDKVSIVGDSVRSVVIRPMNANKDMFRVRNGAYLTGFTFRDGLDANTRVPAYTFNWAVAFDDPTDKSVDRSGYFGLPKTRPLITLSPYVQNCSIISFLGANGCNVDGSKVVTPNTPLIPQEAENPYNPVDGVPQYGKSMVANAFTMVSFGGTGWYVANDGYAQIVSCFQIFCLNGSYCQSGGYLSITNSATNFGLYALRASGYSANSFEFDRGIVAGTGTAGGTITLTTIGTRRVPVNQFVVKFFDPATNNDITSSFKHASTTLTFNAATAVNPTTNVITISSHGLSTGNSVLYSNNGNVDILGLFDGTIYYVQVITSSTFKLYNDNSLTYPVDIGAVGSGTHTFTLNAEEFFVGETMDSHSSYQELTLASGPSYTSTSFVPGQTILGLTEGYQNTAYVYTWDLASRKLIVSNEYSTISGNLQRIYFDNTSTITTVGGSNLPTPYDVDIADSLSNVYYTATSKIISTITGNQIISPGNTLQTKIRFHRPSIVNSSAHTWEYAGSGTDYNALPQNGGVGGGTATEMYSELPGRVYTSGTNELGDFKVGDFIVCENKTGNITFRTRVTVGELNVLRLSLSDVEVSEISTDPGLGDNEPGGASNNRLSVQRAIRTFIANRLGNVLDKQVSANAVPGAVVQLNAQGQINADLLPPARGITTYNVSTWGGRLTLSEQIPAIQVISGDNASESYPQQILEISSALSVTKGDIITQVGQTGYGVVKLTDGLATTLTLVNVVDDWDLVNDIKLNGVTQTGVKILTIGSVTNIVDNYYLRKDTSSQYLILAPNVTYDFTGITTVTGANSGAQGGIASGPIYGIAYSTDATTLVQGSGYTPLSGTNIYYNVPLTTTGSGTGAHADITVTNGKVTAVAIVSGGSGYAAGDTVSAATGDIGGTATALFSIELLRADTRLYVDLLGSYIKFSATSTSPEYIEDANAGYVTISDLTYYLQKTFNAQDISLGGDVNYAQSKIIINSHGFTDGDAVVYGNGGNLVVGNLVNTKTYWVKVLDSNTIELYNNYAFTSGSKVLFGTATTGTHSFTRYAVGTSNSTFTLPGHGLTVGQPIRFVASNPPGGILNNGYYYIGSVTTNGFTLHTNKTDALASVNGVTSSAVLIGTTGSGSAQLQEQNVAILGTVNTSSALELNWAQVAQSTFDAANIVSGVIAASRLAGVGTANNKTFLRGDSSWQYAVQNIRPQTSSPISLVGDYFTYSGSNYYYNSLVVDVDRVDDLSVLGNINYTNLGVAAFSKAQFTSSNGQVTVKTGVIDAGLLNGLPGTYYTNPANLVGVVSVSKGGTGLSTVTKGDIIYSGSNGSLTQLAIGSANSVLSSNGLVPSWSSSLTLGGTLTVAGAAALNDTTASTSTITGALTVAGGVGIQGALYAGSIQNTQIGTLTPNSGAFTTLTSSGNTTFSGTNASVAISPTGTGTASIQPAGGLTLGLAGVTTTLLGNVSATSNNQVITLSPASTNGTVYISPVTKTGSIDNMNIGATTRGTGAFTTLDANDATTLTANTASTSTTSGTLVVTGGVGISGAVYAGSIQNTPIGSTTKSTGAFTTLTANGATTFTANTASTSTTSGTVVVTGGVGVSGDVYATNINASGTVTHNGLVPTTGTSIDQIKQFDKSLTITTSWQDTGIKNTDLVAGTYYLQLFANDSGVGGGHVNTYYSGVISWYDGTTSETTFDEIVINRAGAANGTGVLYLRLQKTVSDVNNLKLQIAGTSINTGASTYTFKFRRLI